MEIKRTKKIKGQSLIETIVAVGIMVIGITAVLTIAVVSLSTSGISKQSIMALNLSREGIEISRAVRDSNWLKNIYCWSVNKCGLENGKYVVDYQTTDSLTSLSGTDFSDCTNCRLYINTDGLYSHNSSGGETAFKRIIEIKDGSSADKKIISSTVQWKDKTGTHSVVLKTILTNWR